MAQSNRRNVMSTDSEPMPVASEVNMQPEHVRTCKQVACAMSCVLDVADRSIMKRSVRMSMAADDCDQTRLMMFKMVTANPIIQVHSCVAAIIRDPGHGIDDAVKATMDGINQSCLVRVGPLDKDTLESPASYVDTTLEQHIHKVMVSAASDGCEVEVQAVQKLWSTNKLPDLRYFFRDTCHTIGCTAKMITKYLKHDDTALLEILVTGKGSFAKRVQYSRAFQARWVAKQKADIGALLNICKNLGFNETRYHSRTDPMCNLMGHWSACLDVLVDVSTSDLASSDEARWAAHIVQECAGLKGFQRLVSFSVECDFFHNLSEAVKVHDAKKNDVSVSHLRLEECLLRGQAMFELGYIFDSEPNASYTWQFLDGARRDMTLYFGKGSSRTGVFGWEAIDKSHLERPMKSAKSLYHMMKDHLLAEALAHTYLLTYLFTY